MRGRGRVKEGRRPSRRDQSEAPDWPPGDSLIKSRLCHWTALRWRRRKGGWVLSGRSRPGGVEVEDEEVAEEEEEGWGGVGRICRQCPESQKFTFLSEDLSSAVCRPPLISS